MTHAIYNQLVTKTFRNNAIRSVMMIDDDFVPYDELCVTGFKFDDLPASKQRGTEKAANIHKFFQQKKIVCDVDKGDSHIDIEKIRKCDLVILDYHLEHEDPRKSLALLKNLSATEHMNLVVVYTREELDKVWLSVSACLVGSISTDALLADDANTNSVWEEKTEYSASVPQEWSEIISVDDIVSYIKTGNPTSSTAAWFGQTLRGAGKSIARIMCERSIESRNMLATPKSATPLVGENGTQKWMQFDNVFIVLHQKTTEENPDEPSEIWNSIEAALIDWQPSYYQLLISEMQNRLENESISFSKNLSSDSEGQAAWLYQIIQARTPDKRVHVVNQLFERLTNELSIKLAENTTMRDLLDSTFESLTQSFDESPVNLLDFATAHTKVVAKTSLTTDVGHALNYTLCTRDFDGKFVTSGTVLYDKDDETKWYLCVAPACETIPLQATGLLAKRLKPHRMMKVMVLEKCSIKSALEHATESNYIFVMGPRSERKALSVLNGNTGQPVIDYVLIKNHDTSSSDLCKNGLSVSFLAINDQLEFSPAEKILVPISQLRDMYTARFQAMASHHTGRVGVDFVKFN